LEVTVGWYGVAIGYGGGDEEMGKSTDSVVVDGMLLVDG
jgi:hypothetical protein